MFETILMFFVLDFGDFEVSFSSREQPSFINDSDLVINKGFYIIPFVHGGMRAKKYYIEDTREQELWYLRSFLALFPERRDMIER